MGTIMTSFHSPSPITAVVDLALAANVRLVAGGDETTNVSVQPRRPGYEPDERAAQQVTIEFSGDRLSVVLRPWGGLGWFNDAAIDVEIHLPANSELDVQTSAGRVRCEGSFGTARVRTGAGDISIDEAGPLTARAGAGDITVERVGGRADLTAGSGRIQVRHIDGTGNLHTSNGSTYVAEVTGALSARSANGSIEIDHASGDVTAQTSNGSITVHDVSSGSVDLKTALGSLEVGVRRGTAAWLDLSSKMGKVRNELEDAHGPEDSDRKVEIHARTSMGSIRIRQAS